MKTLGRRVEDLERQIPKPAEAGRWDLSRLTDAELTDFERLVIASEAGEWEPTEAEDIRLAELAAIAGPNRRAQ